MSEESGRKKHSIMTVKRRRHTPEQIIRKLAQGHKEIEAENAHLKKLVVNQALDIDMLREISEGILTPNRKRKKRLTGIGTHVGEMCPIVPNALWALDFQFDTTAEGPTLKMLNVIDEFTRECLAIEVDRSIDADGVVAVLDRLAIERGTSPAFIGFDNGPEFIAYAVADWYRFNDTDSIFIDPGSPWQNAWIKSFNSRFRDEALDGWQFDSLLEARATIEDWRIDYNMERPHTAHGDLTPTEVAAKWTNNNQP